MKITVEDLMYVRACDAQVKLFLKHYPCGGELCVRSVVAAYRRGLNLTWLVETVQPYHLNFRNWVVRLEEERAKELAGVPSNVPYAGHARRSINKRTDSRIAEEFIYLVTPWVEECERRRREALNKVNDWGYR